VAAQAPVVNVNVTIGGAGTSAPAAAAPSTVSPVPATPAAPLVAAEPAAPVMLPRPASPPSSAATEFVRCRGITRSATLLAPPKEPDLSKRLEQLPRLPHSRAIVAHVTPPQGKQLSDVVAQATISDDGWFVAEAFLPSEPVWFVVPGYEPVGFNVDLNGEGPQNLGEVTFRPSMRTGSEIAVHVDGPCSDLTTSLIADPCPDAVRASRHGKGDAMAGKQGRDPVFDGLSQTPFRVLTRGLGCTSAEVDVMGKPGRIDVPITLETARRIELDYLVAKPAELCRAKTEHLNVVPGEHFTLPGTQWLWLKQQNQRLSFEKTAMLTGGYIGHGALNRFCNNPTPAEPFGDHEVLNDDVFMVMDMAKQRIALMRFSVR
jgi:hypothetical protein